MSAFTHACGRPFPFVFVNLLDWTCSKSRAVLSVCARMCGLCIGYEYAGVSLQILINSSLFPPTCYKNVLIVEVSGPCLFPLASGMSRCSSPTA